MQGNNKQGKSKTWKGNSSKELDGMFHAKGKAQKRKRRAHRKAIETKLRQRNKRLCRQS